MAMDSPTEPRADLIMRVGNKLSARMNDTIVWIIIAAFYAPLHYLSPVLFLFITGREDETTRARLMRNALVDSTLSMAIAFAVVILMVRAGHLFPAMIVLLLSMGFPFIRIWRHRKEIEGVA